MNLAKEIRADWINGRDIKEKMALLDRWLEIYQREYDELNLLNN